MIYLVRKKLFRSKEGMKQLYYAVQRTLQPRGGVTTEKLAQRMVNEHLQNKIAIFLAFITVTILGGMWWDWKTYLWNKNTLVDEMPVAEVSRRMSTFRYWTHYEVWAVAIWTIVFTALFYWVMDYYMLPLGVQAVLLICYIIWDVILIYFIYKRLIYKHLDNIKKNIEELKDICTE